jgi:transcriptional regulator with XRE-family HTH domain
MGQRLKELRRARELTQEQLARTIGVGLDAVRKWERGDRTPRLDMAAKLAEALGVTIDELAGVGRSEAAPLKKKGK